MQTQKPEDQKNLLAAIVLSVGVLLAWQFLYAGPKLKEEQERQRRITAEQQAQAPAGQPAGVGTVGAPPVATPGIAGAPGINVRAGTDRPTALAASKRVTITTPAISGSLNLTGARFDDITLMRHHEKVDPKSPNVVLFSPAAAPDPYFAEYGWVAGAGTAAKLPDKDTVWQVEGTATLTDQSPVKLVWNNGEGIIFRRTISVDQNYMFTVRDEVENGTAKAITLYPYARIFRYGTPKIEGFFIQHEGLIGVLGTQGLNEIAYSDARKDGGGKIVENATGGWLGFTDKYWAAALIPDQKTVYKGQLLSPVKKPPPGSKETFQADYLLGYREDKPLRRAALPAQGFGESPDAA